MKTYLSLFIFFRQDFRLQIRVKQTFAGWMSIGYSKLRLFPRLPFHRFQYLTFDVRSLNCSHKPCPTMFAQTKPHY